MVHSLIMKTAQGEKFPHEVHGASVSTPSLDLQPTPQGAHLLFLIRSLCTSTRGSLKTQSGHLQSHYLPPSLNKYVLIAEKPGIYNLTIFLPIILELINKFFHLSISSDGRDSFQCCFCSVSEKYGDMGVPRILSPVVVLWKTFCEPDSPLPRLLLWLHCAKSVLLLARFLLREPVPLVCDDVNHWESGPFEPFLTVFSLPSQW